MKKKNFVKIFLVTALGILTMACNNDDPAPLPEPIQKLIQKEWKINEITVPKETNEGDSSILKSCSNDDIVHFYSSGTFKFDDGTNKCDSSVFYYSEGYWGYDLIKDSIQLASTKPAEYISWKVQTLNDSVLKVIYTDSLNPAKKLTKTISFKH
jgi:hypothetical protein